jgi:hypothetical protein
MIIFWFAKAKEHSKKPNKLNITHIAQTDPAEPCYFDKLLPFRNAFFQPSLTQRFDDQIFKKIRHSFGKITMNNQMEYMLHQQEVPATTPTVFSAIQELTDQAKHLALQHDFAGLKNCMNRVQRIYKSGNTAVKNAVENIFIFAFSSILPHCNQVEWRLVQSCMPTELYTVYVRQVTKAGC